VHILGVSCYYHDAAAALLQDGVLVAAAEEERFSRIKHDYAFPKNAIQFCLDQAGLEGRELDCVVFFEKPFRKFDRILMSTLQTYPRSWKVFRESMISWMIDKLWIGT
jgi:carbamoyltransferase